MCKLSMLNWNKDCSVKLNAFKFNDERSKKYSIDIEPIREIQKIRGK